MNVILDAKLNSEGIYEYTGINEENLKSNINDILIGIDKILKYKNYNKILDDDLLIKYLHIKNEGNYLFHKTVIIKKDEYNPLIFLSNLLFKNGTPLEIIKEEYFDYEIDEFNLDDFIRNFVFKNESI